MATDRSPDYRLGYSHGVEATQQEYEGKLDEMYEDGYEAGREMDSEDSYNEGFEEGRKSRWSVYGVSTEVFLDEDTDSLYIKRGGEYRIIDLRTGDDVEVRFSVPQRAYRVI